MGVIINCIYTKAVDYINLPNYEKKVRHIYFTLNFQLQNIFKQYQNLFQYITFSSMDFITESIFFLDKQFEIVEDYKEQVTKMMPDYAYYKFVFSVLNSSFYKRFTKTTQIQFMKSCIFYQGDTFFESYMDIIQIFFRMKLCRTKGY